jgi:membrane protease subunit (stomatin/prohibitin family)
MAMLNIIEFFDDTGDIMVAKAPPEGSGEFKTGAQLIVQESQEAVFFRDGQALDSFGPGRHTLSTENLPFLGRLLGTAFGKSPFRAHVCFVALKTFTNLGWGTPTPVLFRDTDFRMVSLRAHGSYAIRIDKPRIFLQTLVGSKGMETTYAIEDYFRRVIVSKLTETIGGTLKSILDLPVHYGQIAAAVKQAVRADFGQYGVELVDLVVEAITVPPEVQAMINKATGIAAQDAQKYQAIASADAYLEAAKNPGGSAGQGLGAGLGLGMGLAMAKQALDQASASAPQAPRAAPEPAPARRGATEIRAEMKELKGMLDDGLINAAEYEQKRQKLLGEL